MASYQGASGGIVCANRGCFSNSRTWTMSLFRFPKDVERAREWLRACNREDLLDRSPEALYGNYRLCELHFENNMFSNKSKKKTFLIPQAVPTIFSHETKRETGDDDLKEEAVKREKVNILSDIQTLPSVSFLEEPSTSKELYVGCETLAMGDSFCSNMSGTLIMPSVSFFDEPSTSRQLSEGCGTLVMEDSSCLNMSGNLLIKMDDLEETPSSLISPSAMTQTSASLSSQTPRKQKLRRALMNIKKKSAAKKVSNTEKKFSLDDFDKICDKFLSRNLADIVKIQARLESRKAKGRRYTTEYKQFA